MKEQYLGFLGLGSIGFPMCYGLAKCGYKLILPTYRRREDEAMGFSPLAPDQASKAALIDEMLAGGCLGATSQAELIQKSDVILTNLPTSAQVERIVLGEEGVLGCARPGTILIDMTSADPMSTKRLSALLEEKGLEMLDAPISGGLAGAIAQTLTIMVGGKENIFTRCRPILDTIGNPDKVLYIGPSGAGHTIKVANNFLSACCTAATTEAVLLAVKAGIAPEKAIEVIQSSGGRSDASMNKYPNLVFPGKSFNFSLDLMCKDVGLFNQVAKTMKLPTFLSNLVHQMWTVPVAEVGGDKDCLEFIKLYERWYGVQVCGITAPKQS